MPAILLLSCALAMSACVEPGDAPFRSTGSYPVDIFQEMHYNQTYKSQEPPRLAPPSESVPITGKELPLPTLKTDAKSMTNPVAIDPTNLDRAAVLYHINCAACHGLTSQGDGPVGLKFAEYGAPQPPSFSSDRINSLSPGETFWSITKGAGFMPPFGNLLTAEDRWLIVHLISLSETERQDVLSKTKAPGDK